jgi:murein L,D-transpeptidase YcbB/YkuD
MFLWTGCKNGSTVKEKEIVKTPEQMDDLVSDNIQAVLLFANTHNGMINDSIRLSQFALVNSFYQQNNYRGVWSKTEKWNAVADSLFRFIKDSRYFGLYPNDYHFRELDSLRMKISRDSLVRMDAIAWTKADLMLSDAFLKTLKDISEGRTVPDSESITLKSNYRDSFFFRNLDNALATGSLRTLFEEVEPANHEYLSLREALKPFVDSMDTQKYLYIDYPYDDTAAFKEQLHQRLLDNGIGVSGPVPDSARLSNDVKIYQARHKLTVDGKAGEGTIESLDANDNEKFKRIAITLDRYKQLPSLPETYVWVNLPEYRLRVWDHDSVVLESKVIIGKPDTRTPVLTSAISNMVIYPNWTIPQSIIRKDILPALKKDPGYLARKGFSLVDYNGDEVNPFAVDWTKYKKGIPWKIVQGSGDDNALGIFKFNFSNPYSVYLHDTNQRYLFSNTKRALSHGCVRVQKWEDLAFFIARKDSLATREGHPLSYNIDSLKTWIADKDRKTVMVKKRLPLYIEYFSCGVKDGSIIFYNDIYNDDRSLAQKYFPNK